MELAVERQEEACRAWASEHGATIGRVHIDNDLSATKSRSRPAFEQLLASGTTGILTWHLDRLVRVSRDLERVIALDVNVHTVKSGFIDLSTPAGRAVARTVTAWSTYEGEQKAERQKLSHAQRRAAGRPWWPTRPFGYEKDGSALREPEAVALREVYEGLLNGVSLYSLTRRLNEQGFMRQNGTPWRPVDLRQTVLAPRNAGIMVYKGEEVGPGAWPALVPEETFRATVRLLSDPGRAQLFPHRPSSGLLTGVAVCDRCGRGVEMSKRQSKAGERRVYTCRVWHVSAEQEWLDDYVSAEVVARLMRDDAVALFATPVPSGDDVKKRTVRLRQKLVELRADYDDDVITRSEFRESVQKVRERLVQAEAELAQLGMTSPVAALLAAEDLLETWESWDRERQREVIRTVLDIRLLSKPPGTGLNPPGEYVRLAWRGKPAEAAAPQ